MRASLKLGVPIAAGLATGGYALSQGEDLGSAALAAGAGGLGGAAGLLAARGLAGKYAAPLREAAEANLTGTPGNPKGIGSLFASLRDKIPADRRDGLRMGALQKVATGTADVLEGATSERGLGKLLAAGLVPGSAALAGLGGVAAGAVPGSMGVPGFVQSSLDPESYGSSNSPGARYKAPTMQYV